MQLRLLLVVLLQLTSGAALLLPARPARSSAVVMAGGFFDAIAKDPLGMLKNNLQQMSDQRVAQVSHVMLRTDPAALAVRTKGECFELLTQWKDVIGDDPERFAQCARERSECASKSRGGDLGYNTRAQSEPLWGLEPWRSRCHLLSVAAHAFGTSAWRCSVEAVQRHRLCRGGWPRVRPH